MVTVPAQWASGALHRKRHDLERSWTKDPWDVLNATRFRNRPRRSAPRSRVRAAGRTPADSDLGQESASSGTVGFAAGASCRALQPSCGSLLMLASPDDDRPTYRTGERSGHNAVRDRPELTTCRPLHPFTSPVSNRTHSFWAPTRDRDSSTTACVPRSECAARPRLFGSKVTAPSAVGPRGAWVPSSLTTRHPGRPPVTTG